jgi:hypothetical protein
MWHVVFAEHGRLPQSRAARSRDHAIQVACELLSQSLDVRRILEPNGRSIERAELNEHYDQGKSWSAPATVCAGSVQHFFNGELKIRN